MKGPILVRAESELMVFDTPEAVEGYVEWQDVASGVYPLIFDSEGRRLELVVEQPGGSLRRRRVVLRSSPSLAASPEDLRRLLEDALQIDQATEKPLKELVESAHQLFRQV
jgi:hypothetical protein